MARRSDLMSEVAAMSDVPPDTALSLDEARRRKQQARRTEAMSLRLAGLSYEQIGERLGVSTAGAFDMIRRTVSRAENLAVSELREVEGARLDRAQAAVWTKVLEGDERAVDTFLRISHRRAKLFGLDEPTKIDLSVGIRQEMNEALNTLQQVVLGEVIHHDETDDGTDRETGAAALTDHTDVLPAAADTAEPGGD